MHNIWKLFKDNARPIALVIVGNIIYALTVKLFLLPANLISSGTTGLALIANELFGFSMPVFIFVFNLLMLIVGLVILGKRFVATTILSSALYPLFLGILNRIMGEVAITDNTLLNVIFSGLGLGIALGTVLRQGASTGGMDIPPLILKRYFKIPIAVSLYVFDFCIMLGQMFYHEPEDLLYGIILLILTSLTLNKVLIVGTTKSEVKIVSLKSDEIRREILSEIDRGVTMMYGKGGYIGKETEIILSVVSNREINKIEKIVRKIDPESFMIITNVVEVWGRGFSKEKKYR